MLCLNWFISYIYFRLGSSQESYHIDYWSSWCRKFNLCIYLHEKQIFHLTSRILQVELKVCYTLLSSVVQVCLWYLYSAQWLNVAPNLPAIEGQQTYHDAHRSYGMRPNIWSYLTLVYYARYSMVSIFVNESNTKKLSPTMRAFLLLEITR